jgi:HSP20 family protein
MSSLMRWDPSEDMISLRDMMDRLFQDSVVRPHSGWATSAQAASLAIDMYETKDDVLVKATLPGVKSEDVDLSITGDTLTIRGEMKEEKESNAGNYIRRERRYGEFARSIELPSGLQTDKTDASFENGVLTIQIPKSEQIKPKSVKIKTKS